MQNICFKSRVSRYKDFDLVQTAFDFKRLFTLSDGKIFRFELCKMGV